MASMSAVALDRASLRCGSCLGPRKGCENVSSSGRWATGVVDGQWGLSVHKFNDRIQVRNSRPKIKSSIRAESSWFAGQESAYGFGPSQEGNDRFLSPCYATSTARSDSLSVPGHWGLSDGISKELVTDQEIGVVYANESSSAAAGHIGVVRDGQSEGGSSEQKLTSGAAAGTPEVQQHTQGMTADGFRVVDEDLAGNGGGIHDDGRECTNAEPIPVRIGGGRSSRRLAPASLSQSMQAVSGRGLKAVVGVANPLLNNPGQLKGSTGMAMAATLTVAGVVGAVSQGANLLSKAGTQAPAKLCKDCKGEGRVACDLCQGTGQIRWEGKYRHKDECPSCEGRGEAKCHCKAAQRAPVLARK